MNICSNKIHDRSSLSQVSTSPRQRPSSYSTSCSSCPAERRVTSAPFPMLTATLAKSATLFPATRTLPSSFLTSSVQTLAVPRRPRKSVSRTSSVLGPSPVKPMQSPDRSPSESAQWRKRGTRSLLRIWLGLAHSRLPQLYSIARSSRVTVTWLPMGFVL